MASRKTLALAAFATALACAGPALAEPSAADRATARTLMAEGRAARDRGDANAALKAFSAADVIMHVPTTGLELARSQVAVRALVEARDTALRVVRTPESASDPAPFRAAREAALALVKELDKRVPTLAIAVSGGPPAHVTIDGIEVPAAELAQPRRVNPGHHTIQASFDGVATGETKPAAVDRQVDLAEGDAKRVSLEAPATAGSAPPPSGQQEAAAEPAAAERAETATENPQPEATASAMSPVAKVLTYGGFGVAGVGVLVGAVSGLVTLTATSSIKSSGHCFGDTCGPEEYGRISSANTTAMIANVSFAVAGAGAVAGLVGLLLPKTGGAPSLPPSEEPGTTTSRIEPWLGIGSAGVRGRF